MERGEEVSDPARPAPPHVLAIVSVGDFAPSHASFWEVPRSVPVSSGWGRLVRGSAWEKTPGMWLGKK